ncbi:MAG: hypothetical protein WB421_10715 [Terriglobales bacterium]
MPSKLLRRLSYVLLLSALCLVLSFRLLGKQTRQQDPDLTAHEWGTFTSIAGSDGKAMQWLPLNGSDLPMFVETFRGSNFKINLRGTVRMETPVLYFYSPHETTLSVKVAFSKGLITEWYPHASRVEPSAMVKDESLYKNHADGSIAWDSIQLMPSLNPDFPREKNDNRYYSARETSSTPLRIKTQTGFQQEKFLFYRGVSTFPVPISAKITPDGKVLVSNLNQEAVPNVILFERRGDKMGYRVGGLLQSEMTLDPPELNGTVDSLNTDSLNNELEGILVGQGLFPDEAHAMVETWRDSWSEEGSRLIYIVPSQFVNTILPLAIRPAPAQTTRVFVGRLELIPPATEQAVETAFLTNDGEMIGKYFRFELPILKAAAEHETDPVKLKKINDFIGWFYKPPAAR